MNNDPMSQMAAAQRLTISQLQESIRNGTINLQVGQIVLASKIKQDKTAKMAMAAQAPKQPPVAEQNLAYGAGVDALPSNLPVEGMAQGGIVSFAEGGYMDNMYMPMSINQYNALLPAQKQIYVNQYGAPPEDTTPRINPLTGTKTTALDKALRQGTPLRPETPVSAPRIEQFNIANTYPKTESTKAPAKDQPSMIDSMLSGNASGSNSTRTKGTGTGIGGYEIKPYTEAENQLKAQLESEMNSATGKEYTYDETAARRKEQQKAAGIDFDLYGNQKTELEGKKNLSDTRSRLNEAMPFFALADRLGQAPKPGDSRITPFASGLAEYGKSKAEIDDKEEARQERIGDKLNALAVAQNSFNAAQFSGNDADLKEARNQLKTTRAALSTLGIKGVDQQNEMAKTVYEVKSKERIAAMQESGANTRTSKTYNKEYEMMAQYADQFQADAEKAGKPINRTTALDKAYKMTKFQASVFSANTRDVDSQRDALNAQLKLISKFDRSPEAIEKRKQINDALAALSPGVGSAGATTQDYTGFDDKTIYK